MHSVSLFVHSVSTSELPNQSPGQAEVGLLPQGLLGCLGY